MSLEAHLRLMECSQGALCSVQPSSHGVNCLLFLPPKDPSLPPPGVSADTLDDFFLEMCLQGVASQLTAGVSPPACADPLECTSPMALDDPFLTEFTDLHSLLGPANPIVEASVQSPSLGVMDDNFTDGMLGLETPSPSSELTSSLSSPLAGILTTDPSISPSPSPSLENGGRKRSREDVPPLASPLLPESKQRERRLKNNIASQVSRAKRRAKTKSLFQREKDLREENARLRVKMEKMSREAERLRTMLITKLSH